MSIEVCIDEEAEFEKLKILMKKMDHQYYHKIVAGRQQYTARYFPHRGETGVLFNDTFQYVRTTTKKWAASCGAHP